MTCMHSRDKKSPFQNAIKLRRTYQKLKINTHSKLTISDQDDLVNVYNADITML